MSQSEPTRVVFVAALRREIAGLVRGWKRVEAAPGVECFIGNGTVVACGGMGTRRAVMAADAALREVGSGQSPLLVSVGWAGACDPALRVGEIVEASVVMDARTGERFFPASAPEVGLRAAIVTVATPAGVAEKQRLHASYAAAAVEMEAAAVARVAEQRGLRFAAIKAISDAADFEMPAMTEFVREDGQMREAAFGLHVALRPRLWRPVMEMARGSGLAAERLWAAMTEMMHGVRNG